MGGASSKGPLVHKVPYSGNLLQVKTFAVSGRSTKVLTAKIFIEYGGVIINGRVIVVSHNSRKFQLLWL